MTKYERDYIELLEHTYAAGNLREGRNGKVHSLFGRQLTVNLQEGFPILQGRKMFYEGVFGELACMIRGEIRHISDFKRWGCNYWDQWADEDGTLRLDYGNAWRDYYGIDQLKNVLRTLQTNPYDRRMIITGWRPDRLAWLTLPCCHHTYQFYVDNHKGLHMLWMQRSVDLMVGLPSDVIFAAAWLIAMANTVNMIPATITFSLGDCHVYDVHSAALVKYLQQSTMLTPSKPTWSYSGKHVMDFTPLDLVIDNYYPGEVIKMEVVK